jgi:hypothetical protein
VANKGRIYYLRPRVKLEPDNGAAQHKNVLCVCEMPLGKNPFSARPALIALIHVPERRPDCGPTARIRGFQRGCLKALLKPRRERVM